MKGECVILHNMENKEVKRLQLLAVFLTIS